MGKKVLITATVLSHIAQFHKPLVELLHSKGYEIHVAAKNNLADKNGLKIDWVDRVFDVPFARSPKSADNIKAYRTLKKILAEENYGFIHCNTPMGSIVTRLAARNVRKDGCLIIYTAHGFHFHKRASKIAWMLYYPIERLFARFTDKLITINHEDYELAKKHFACQSYYTHGVGVNAQRYVPLYADDERNDLCGELCISPIRRVILSVGELLPNKNQKMVIKAMSVVIKEFPNALLIIAGNGPLKEELSNLILSLGLQKHVKMIGYCTFLEKYQKIASVLAACSYREGLPLNLVEAMLAENPVVASHNRGHDELVIHGDTGFLVEPDDSNGMAQYIIELLSDDDKRLSMGKRAHSFALDYSFENVKQELCEIYGV